MENIKYDPKNDYYKRMGVSPTASDEEIKCAYKTLARKHHPDRQTTEEGKKHAHDVFVVINEANQTLTDKNKRTLYDYVREQYHQKRQRQQQQRQQPPPSSAPRTRSQTQQQRNNGSGSSSAYGRGYDAGPNPSSRQSNSCQGRRNTHESSSPGFDNEDFARNFFRQSRAHTRTNPSQNQGASRTNNSWQYNSGHSHSDDYGFRYNTYDSSERRQPSSPPPQRPNSRSKRSTPKTSGDPRTRFHQQRPSPTSGSAQAQGRRRQDQQQQQARVYGRRKDGEPCLRCQKLGGFCFQHEDQDPAAGRREGYGGRRTANHQNTSAASGPNRNNAYYGVAVFGICKDGEPCRRCIAQVGYCYQHEYQRHHGTRSGTPRPRPTGTDASSSTTRYGVNKNGEPCQRCINQGRFCYQHVDQQRF